MTPRILRAVSEIALQALRRLGRKPSPHDQAAAALIADSALFNADWYLARYPDATKSGLSPALHYLCVGAAQGNDPGPAFSSNGYLARYPDVAAAGMNPLLHYLRFGSDEGREIAAAGTAKQPPPRAVGPWDVRREAPLAAAEPLRFSLEPWPAELDGTAIESRRDGPTLSLSGVSLGLVGTEGAAANLKVVAAFARLSGVEVAEALEIRHGATSARTEVNRDTPEQDALLSLGSAAGFDFGDVWFINERDLRVRFNAPAGSRQRFVLRCYQFAPASSRPTEPPTSRRLLRLAERVAPRGELDFADLATENPYLPLLFTLTTVDGAMVAASLLPFPSLCRGGAHYGELLAASDGQDYLTALRRVSHRFLAERLSDAGPPALARIEIDLSDATRLPADAIPSLRVQVSHGDEPMAGARIVATKAEGAVADVSGHHRLRSRAHAIFVFNLLQDVSILRPLAFMAARDFGFSTEFLVVDLFSKRDVSGAWQRELDELARAVGAAIVPYGDAMDAWPHLEGKAGLLFAGSESSLPAHAATHGLFRAAPASFITVALQHGFECVGLLQSREHDLAHGREVVFAADVVCVWCDAAQLTSLAVSQRSKLHVTGPPGLLQARPRAPSRGSRGLVCENLHSVRFNGADDSKPEFLAVFSEFCGALAKQNREVVLRPHPGGQWVEKSRIPLPKTVTVNNNPIYKVDLSQYAYGVSAPSSILLDMVLAGIPTAVWRGSAGVIDASNYRGLTEIFTLSDWLDFSREATEHPARFIDGQKTFLEQQRMPLDPADVYRRYAALFLAAARRVNEPSRRAGAAVP